MCKIMMLNLEGTTLFADDADNKSMVERDTRKQWLYWLMSDDLINQGATFVRSTFKINGTHSETTPKDLFGPPLWQGNTILTLSDHHTGDNTKGSYPYILQVVVSGTTYQAGKRNGGGPGVTTSNPTIRNH